MSRFMSQLVIIPAVLFSVVVYAQDPQPSAPNMPEPKPTSPGQEKVEEIRTHGGALKVQKKPAKIEGLNAPVEGEKHGQMKSKKKVKKEETKTEETK